MFRVLKHSVLQYLSVTNNRKWLDQYFRAGVPVISEKGIYSIFSMHRTFNTVQRFILESTSRICNWLPLLRSETYILGCEKQLGVGWRGGGGAPSPLWILPTTRRWVAAADYDTAGATTMQWWCDRFFVCNSSNNTTHSMMQLSRTN